MKAIIGWSLLALLVISAGLNIKRRGFRKYAMGVLTGLDELGNALLGGDHDETISARCARGQAYWYWRVLARILNWIVPGHIPVGR